MSFLAVLDPYVMVWDREDFLRDSTKYYLLASDLMGLLEILEEINPELLLRQQMIDEIVDNFPAYELVNTFPQLKDVNFAFYSFISKANRKSVQFQPTQNVNIQFSPNLIKQYISQSFKNEILYLLTEMYNNCNEAVFFTLERIWEGGSYLEILSEDYIKLFTVIKNIKETDDYLNSSRNKFEENPKHRELGGWDTKLKTPIHIVISLLDDAVEGVGESKALFNYCNSDEQFIIFRPHEHHKYHAYPAEVNEVPALVRKKLICRIEACGKRRRILKGSMK